MADLVARSIAVIKDGQAPGGAYVACPHFPTYRYCWFRDGTFVAHAMDTWGEHDSAGRFYDWAARTVLERAGTVERCVAAAARGAVPDPADLLHTRYTLDGRPSREEWPNFQLDGFGTLLWGLQRHPTPAGHRVRETSAWLAATRLLVRYVSALWPYPNSDCWEEFPDRIAVSTLAALHAGLHAAAHTLGTEDADGRLAAAAAAAIQAGVRRDGVRNGHLVKQMGGDGAVDAGLLWAAVPFGGDGLLSPSDTLMRATAARVEADLRGATGGVHRYRGDTYYGGGEWVLLTALLGEYHAALGDMEQVRRCLSYIEAQADAQGYLPEQTITTPLDASYVAPWTRRWGPVARPLLWSHAAYLCLRAELTTKVPRHAP